MEIFNSNLLTFLRQYIPHKPKRNPLNYVLLFFLKLFFKTEQQKAECKAIV